jgi:hypothetical protein
MLPNSSTIFTTPLRGSELRQNKLFDNSHQCCPLIASKIGALPPGGATLTSAGGACSSTRYTDMTCTCDDVCYYDGTVWSDDWLATPRGEICAKQNKNRNRTSPLRQLCCSISTTSASIRRCSSASSCSFVVPLAAVGTEGGGEVMETFDISTLFDCLGMLLSMMLSPTRALNQAMAKNVNVLSPC